MPRLNITTNAKGPVRRARWALDFHAIVFIGIAAACSTVRADEPSASTQPIVQSELSDRASEQPGARADDGDETESTAAAMLKDRRVRRWWFTMGWGLFIIAAFLAGASAIIIFSRRFQSLVGREPPEPTNCEDAWSMHVTPPIDDVPADPREYLGDDNGD